MRCTREGCNKRVNVRANGDYYQYCRGLCRLVDEELKAAQRVCEYFGDHGDFYAAAVALSDALTELDNIDYAVLRVARDLGISPVEYRAIKIGARE